MSGILKYKCVNCGALASALFKTYGPSVLKLTKCDKCNGIVDKYIEYDPVIVMIDLVLISKEAQRHVIYNTNFKSYWKLLIFLTMLETYGVWRNDSLFNIAVNSICNIQNNSTINSTHIALPAEFIVPEPWKSDCVWWVREEREDLFIWEKDFYIQFLSTFSGSVAFTAAVHAALAAPAAAPRQPGAGGVCRAAALGGAAGLAAVPALVWGPALAGGPAAPHGGPSPATPYARLLYHALVAAYCLIVFHSVFSVVYARARARTAAALAGGAALKAAVVFHATARLRTLLL